jgi:hypothetical protein
LGREGLGGSSPILGFLLHPADSPSSPTLLFYANRDTRFFAFEANKGVKEPMLDRYKLFVIFCE